MKKVKVYISGAISSLPYEHAREMFAKAEEKLIERNFEPINPFNNGLDKDASWSTHMKEDIKRLMDCDCIYMLNTWTKSKGAMLEYQVAKGLGIGIIHERNE